MADCISVRSLNRRPRVRVGLALFALLAAAAHAAPALTVTQVQYWSLGDTTRVSVEVSGDFRHQSDRLAKPDRLFFDIAGAKPGMVEKGEFKIAVGDALLKQIRVAETRPGTTRVVLDLEGGVEFTSSQLSKPDRLMIELRAKNAKAAPSATPPRFAPLEPSKSAPPPPAVTKSEPAPLPVQETLASVAKPVTTPVAIAKPPAPKPAPAGNTPPQAAARNSNGDRSLTRVLGLKLGRIVIDPGHGGHDPGTHGKSGLLEKDLVLDVSKRLAKLLEERLEAEVILTRTDDSFVALEERAAMANNAKADLFLSIHANSNPSRGIAGVETYYLNFSASREDLDLATRENATAQTTIAEMREVISKIALRAKVDESREFAVQLHNTLNQTARSENKDVKERPVKKAPFVVLIGAEMPAVLAEIGYLSNARDEDLFKTEGYRDQVAKALFDGIAAYMKTLGQGPRAALE